MILSCYEQPMLSGYDPKHKMLYKKCSMSGWDMSTHGNMLTYQTNLYYRAYYGFVLAGRCGPSFLFR